MKTCASCGSEELEPGEIQSTGKIYFRPNNARFLAMKSADVPISAVLCVDCGFLMLVGDAGKAKRLVSRAAPARK